MKRMTLSNAMLIGAGCACLIVTLLSMGRPVHAEVITLEQSVEYALEHNANVGIARENIKKAKGTVDEALSAGMPKVNVTGTYTRLDKVSSVSFGGNTIKLNSLDSEAAQLTLSQPIDLSGIIKTGLHAAKMDKSSVQYEYDQVRNDTTLLVKEAYYSVLRAQQFQGVQSRRVDQLEAHLKDARLNLKAGTAAPFDVLRAETEVADAEQGLITAQNGVALAKSDFNNTLGRALDAPVELQEPGQPQHVDLQLAPILDAASTERPEVLRMQSLQGFTKDLVQIARKTAKPQMNLLWTMDQNLTTTVFNPRTNSWRGLVTVSMPLYDGGNIRAKVDQAKADASTATLGYDQTLLGVKLDAQQAYLNLNESWDKIAVAEKALDQAREGMRLAEVRYKGEVSTQLELFDAQTALTQAETNHVNAVYDYYTAMAQLEKAVGGPDQLAKLIGQ